MTLPSNSKAPATQRGAALLLVLAAIVLMTVMILALFLSLSSEARSSKLYATDSSVKLLAQSAVNLVEGEIFQATSDPTLCWASQPGMIRTYTTTPSGTTSLGTANSYFKLYSDSSMTGTGTFDHTVAGLVPDGTGTTTAWYSQKGVYIDLNQPLSVGGVNQYPIVDGDLNNPSTSTTGNDLFTYTYPTGQGGAASLPTLMTPTPSSGTVTVYGPALPAGTPQVAGFWVNSNASRVIDPRSPNQVPMPVKWLYVLKDGSIAVPDSETGGTTVTFNNSTAKPTGPSGTFTGNQIIGRIAFWTDDETSKININTASEGSYNSITGTGTTTVIKTSFNDTPRVCTPYDLQLATAPSWQNEFQRYPGHPATVSLSTVFGNLTTDPSYPEDIYSLLSSTNAAPRTTGGGSTEASVTYATTGTILPVLGNRLYATPDEILLHPDRTTTSSYIDQPALKRSQFFITASSRAPDVNVFNLPRVCIWPINANQPVVTYQTAYDQLIAFCTTIGGNPGNPYYFQRADWTSSTENTSIPRNTTLLSYLKTLCSTAIPGFTKTTFASKYSTTNSKGGTELDQILMEIFDYIRATNIYDSSLVAARGKAYNNVGFNIHLAPQYGFGEVVPTYNSANDTKGIGRYPIISKAGILFIASGTGSITPSTAGNPQVIGGVPGTPTFGPTIPTTSSAPGKVRVQAALLFQLFDPAQGYTALSPDCNIRVVNSTMVWNLLSTGPTGTLTTGNTSPLFNLIPGTGTATVAPVYPTGGTAQQGPAWGGNLGILPMINAYSGSLLSWVPTTSSGSSTPANPFPDFSATGTIMFSGTVEVQVVANSGTTTYPNLGTTPNVIQDITFNFPADSVAVPSYVGPSPTFSSTQEEMSNFTAMGSFQGRLSYNGNSTDTSLSNNLARFFVTSKDVMQGLQCSSGDLRLVAGHQTITPTSCNPPLFGPNPNWGSQFAHNFVDGYGMPWYGATRGQLVSGVTSYWTSTGSSVPLTTPYNFNGGASNDPWFILKQASVLNAIQTCEPEGFGTGTTGTFTGTGTIAGVTSGAFTSWTAASGLPPGDFDNGTGSVRDGPYINKADEGGLLASGYTPYFTDSGTSYTVSGTAYFSPARQMPSAVMFGSLPTGVIDNRPWQTLLFHPDYTGKHVGSAGMGGNGSALANAPADHLLLDLFTMPVVEPYAISEPLSTAGRINMNYLMVPFTYINRDTGVRAVLSSQQMLSVPNTDCGSISTNTLTYKQMRDDSEAAHLTAAVATAPQTLRFSINSDETLKGFAQRFYPKAFSTTSTTPPDIFHSPSEICTLPLVPNDTSSNPSYTSIQSTAATGYWPTHQLTGDNSLERPYANIYPLLTTKSNTFTVHYRVQSLQPLPNQATSYYASWHEGSDVMTSEYRGSQTIERYIDPSATLPDYAGSGTATPPSSLTPLSNFYRFRVVSTKQFNP